ncbi:thermonuclease family protein [Desulfovibrio sp. Huiquan2017]|uniref:thermonuclease family protein n=1 Tax=Desulfovibrio sp. Huiquan2017 TaxID=2816861 RepID=UPI001A92B8FC|nr:thermonuclease family protein [Desulfovibrio sp. Huiquan2017]
MRRHNPLWVHLAALACLFGCLLAFRTAPAGDGTARLIRVLDGDSLRVEYQGRTLELRLIGVDAPEYRQEYSRKARDFTRNFCRDKPLQLEFDTERRDHYGRTLAYVHAGGLMLNEELVRAGLAIPFRVRPNTRYFARFRQAEDEARREQRGFWRKGGLDMTPSRWRRTHPRK